MAERFLLTTLESLFSMIPPTTSSLPMLKNKWCLITSLDDYSSEVSRLARVI